MLSIVIVTRNTADLLAGLLSSIEGDRPLAAAGREVIVVDNGSTDGTDRQVRDRFPWVTYVRNEDNRGFAAAVNRGWRTALGEIVLFLNSDTLLVEGELVKALAFMEDHRHIGILGPQLVYPDLRLQRSAASVPSLLLEMVPRGLLEWFRPERYPSKRRLWQGPTDVASLIGAAVLVRRRLLEELGGFDERFFFFLEETDLCVRAAERGYGVVLFPGAKVIHLQGETVKRTWIKGRIEYGISLYKFIRKHHGPFYYALFVACRFAKNLLFLGLATLLPFLLLGADMRRRYAYYGRLLLWHLKGCPESYGLRS